MRPPPRCLLRFLLPAAFACSSFPENAVLLVQTPGGQEVGVSTPHGIVFAGRTASQGTARIIGYFGDGPAIETCEIVPVAPNLFTADLPIRFPEVEVSFTPPEAGEKVRLAGWDEGERWSASARIERAGGTARLVRDDLPPAVAAFRKEDGRWRLVGLLAPGDAGSALVGPETLWRILFRPRPYSRSEGFPVRPDVR